MRALALDFGERRVGIAISDPTQTVARPLQVLERKSRREDFAAITALVESYQVEVVVMGQPLSLDGTQGPQARRVERYAQALAEHLSVPVVFCDERYTTSMADQILDRNRNRRRRAQAQQELDAVAAAVILQRYLDHAAGVPGGRFLEVGREDKEA